MALVMPEGHPNPYVGPPVKVNQNPWQQYGLDPTQKQASTTKGSLQQAQQGLNYYAQQKGKTIGQDQWNQVAKDTGYTGGDVSGDQYNAAMGWFDKQWNPAQAQNPGEKNNENDPKLGAQNAVNEWKMQAPAAGVPGSFRSNPMYGQQTALMQQILAHPQTMGQQQQDQLAEQQKESANSMMKQMQGQNQQQMVGRGFGANSGQQQQQQQQSQQDMMSQLLGGRRDIAMRAAQQNRQDELGALNASLGMQQQEYGQDMGLSQQALGQMNQNRGANMQELMGNHGINMDLSNQKIQNEQFNKGFGLDFLRYLQQGDQFNQSLGENKRQYNGNMGLNWANFDQNAQNNFLNMLMKGWV